MPEREDLDDMEDDDDGLVMFDDEDIDELE